MPDFTHRSREAKGSDTLLVEASCARDTVATFAEAVAAGVTAHFTRNYFARMNRELGSEFDLDQIELAAVWNAGRQRMEISARFHSTQRVHVKPIDRVFHIRAGEQLRIEISRKSCLPELTADLARHGLRLRRAFTDDDLWFGLLLLERTQEPGCGS